MANELIIIDQQQLQYENEILKLTVFFPMWVFQAIRKPALNLVSAAALSPDKRRKA